MLILRFHLLESKDYNKITRLINKTGFISRKLSIMILVKSTLEHDLLKISLRKVAYKYNITHINIYNFFNKVKDTKEYLEIIDYLKDRKIIIKV